MNRRKALGGILALAGLGAASVAGVKILYSNTKAVRGQMQSYEGLLTEVVNVIIPATDTPGAKEANVQTYLINYMEACASNKEYNNFINGLAALQDTCLQDYDNHFETCDPAQQLEVLEALDRSASGNGLLVKIDHKIRGRGFFTILKALTIEGYCTSQLGATELLAYEPVPAKYLPITTLQPSQKAWALR